MATKPIYVETKDYVNPTPNQIEKEIMEVIKKVEKGVRARKIPAEFIEKTIEDMFSKRIGGYMMVGGICRQVIPLSSRKHRSKNLLGVEKG